jgi:hypothetical protein
MIRTQRAAHPIDAWGSWWMNREGSLSPRWKGGMRQKHKTSAGTEKVTGKWIAKCIWMA